MNHLAVVEPVIAGKRELGLPGRAGRGIARRLRRIWSATDGESLAEGAENGQFGVRSQRSRRDG
jgi:hypothetical protein